MKNIFVEIEFIDINDKVIKKEDIIIEEIYFNIINDYAKYIDAVIIK
ncbi:hypothetical protein [uncultured Tyzzerella sp.]|nr:hypothetical protein [uncultured Tyzzerella sp.]